MSHVLRHVAVVALATVAAAACTAAPEPSAGPSPTATPVVAAPSPTPPPPVRGERVVRTRSVAPEPVVLNGGEQPPVDELLVRGFADAVASWLDAHLTDLQGGGEGLIERIAAPGLLRTSPPALAAVTTDLAAEDRPVEAASYHLLVATDGEPVWLRATVETRGPDDRPATAEFLFVPGQPVTLVAAGPREGGA